MNEKLNVGIIPDGNRKWAGQTGSGLVEAYCTGAHVALDILKTAADCGNIQRMVFFALSQENVQCRSRDELGAIHRGIEVFLNGITHFPTLRVRCYGEPLDGMEHFRHLFEIQPYGGEFLVDLLVN